MILTQEQLVAVMPNCSSPAAWTDALNIAMSQFGIASDADRIAAFLAEIAHESAELTRLEENLNYSAERLQVIWPRRFPSQAVAERYAHNPHALANYVYSMRLGNGAEASGDGWKFRGRGLIMLTGRSNYTLAGRTLKLPLTDCPEMLCTKSTGALVAAWFWLSHGLNPIADDSPDDDDQHDFKTISRIVNGGAVGLTARQKYWVKARKALGLPEV